MNKKTNDRYGFIKILGVKMTSTVGRRVFNVFHKKDEWILVEKGDSEAIKYSNHVFNQSNHLLASFLSLK